MNYTRLPPDITTWHIEVETAFCASVEYKRIRDKQLSIFSNQLIMRATFFTPALRKMSITTPYIILSEALIPSLNCSRYSGSKTI
jgi:hypothetical protein